MLSSEIFLITFVLSLWLISVLICLKRYSLFICFHKRDVPFYDASLINVKLDMGETSPNPETPTKNSMHHMSSSKSGILRPLSPTHNQTHNSCMCDAEEQVGGGGSSGGGGGGMLVNQTSSASTFTAMQNGQICNKCNLMKQSMSTNLYYFTRPNCRSNAINQKSVSTSNFYKSNYTSNIIGPAGMHNNFMKNRYNLDFSNEFYSNGVIYPHRSRTNSSILSKSKLYYSNKIMPTKIAISNTSFSTTARQGAAAAAAAQSAPFQSQHRYNKNSAVQPSNMSATTHQMYQQNLTNKRSVIRNKHFNLMSLDENALNLYRDHHKMFSGHNAHNSTIPENSVDIDNDKDKEKSDSGDSTSKIFTEREVCFFYLIQYSRYLC